MLRGARITRGPPLAALPATRGGASPPPAPVLPEARRSLRSRRLAAALLRRPLRLLQLAAALLLLLHLSTAAPAAPTPAPREPSSSCTCALLFEEVFCIGLAPVRGESVADLVRCRFHALFATRFQMRTSVIADTCYTTKTVSCARSQQLIKSVSSGLQYDSISTVPLHHQDSMLGNFEPDLGVRNLFCRSAFGSSLNFAHSALSREWKETSQCISIDKGHLLHTWIPLTHLLP